MVRDKKIIPPAQRVTFRPGPYDSIVSATLAGMADQNVVSRLWAKDFTLWKPEPKEIVNRLGWLTIAETMADNVTRMDAIAGNVCSSGFNRIVLLGMGGSSLAPEVLARLFGGQGDYPTLKVLDSTDPEVVLNCATSGDLLRTLFIVSSKSGDTVETASLFRYFYQLLYEHVGPKRAGKYFIAITDHGSQLEANARRLGFRDVCLNDPDIGGRYSALSYFGLLPATLTGVNTAVLLERAKTAMRDCGPQTPCDANPAVRLGAALGALALAGRDKLTLLAPPAMTGFGDWLEQLVAESTGKEGVGILPVVDESPAAPALYGSDRVFAHIRLPDDDSQSALVDQLAAAGHPVVDIACPDPYDIGYLFFLWEMATAVASIPLRINPFDQPNVESAKVLARTMVTEFLKNRVLASEAPVAVRGALSAYGDIRTATPEDALRTFLSAVAPEDYITIQAFLPWSQETDRSLSHLRTALRDCYRVAVTCGYGPRYLHSTGQLHKGDRGNGFFIQLTADSESDVPIPDEPDKKQSSITFGVLKNAQAIGDRQALINAGRRVLRFHLGGEIEGGLSALIGAV